MNPLHLVCPHCNASNRVPSDKLHAELNCGKCHAVLLDAHPENLGEAAPDSLGRCRHPIWRVGSALHCSRLETTYLLSNSVTE